MKDTFRKEYTPLTDEQKSLMAKVKDVAAQLEEVISEAGQLPSSDMRCVAIAQTNLEQSIMWAIKGITA